MMDGNRALMKIKKLDLVEQQISLRLKARTLCRTIPTLINPMLTQIERMAIAEAAAAMDELVVIQAELIAVAENINDLEEALGN
ncbi:MAG: hypothetical protein KJ630_01245 [Proteobacteria bacterium]|nr:hypothetical protein [Pseudomonadota bacterium]